jgi:chondroitin AC lyase
MLGDNATSFEIEKIKVISYRSCWWLPSTYYVGTNLVWMIQVQLYRSLATRNTTGIEQGFSRMWEDVIISNTTAEGVQPDWSYHFHSRLLLSASYGQDWANNILLFSQCSYNTQYQIDDQTLSLFANFLIKGDAWMVVTDYWDWNTIGKQSSYSAMLNNAESIPGIPESGQT